MKSSRAWTAATLLPILLLLSGGAGASAAHPDSTPRRFAVAGQAVHFFSTAVIHSKTSSAGETVQRSTDIIRLSGDLNGYVLYHPTSVIDSASGTLVTTGTQIFSGTVAGSAPVLLHDDRFRFEVDLATGRTTGRVHLSRSQDAAATEGWFECNLVIVGTGVTPEGDNLSDYRGECTAHGSLR